jgi:hypothetical protein
VWAVAVRETRLRSFLVVVRSMISTVEYSTVGVVHSVRVIDSRSRRRGAAGCVRDTCRVPLFVRGRGARLQGRNLPDGVVHEKPICFQVNDDGGEREGHKRRRRRRAFSLSRPKIEREREKPRSWALASFLSKSSPSAWNNSPPPSPCHPQLWPGPSGCCWPGASQLWAVKKLKRNWDESPVSTVRDVCAPQLKKSSTKKLTVSQIFEDVKSPPSV